MVKAENLWAADRLEAEDAPELTENQFDRLVDETREADKGGISTEPTPGA